MTLGTRMCAGAALVLAWWPAGAWGYSAAVCDFDGDGKADQVIARNNGVSGNVDWWVLRSTGGLLTFPWGSGSTDFVAGRLSCADVDGDGLSDAVVWRSGAQGVYWVRLTAGGVLSVPFGIAGDNPTVSHDYNGDGRDDLAVWRPGGGAAFWVRDSASGAFSVTAWGSTGDFPHAMDFSGDGRADTSIQRSGGFHWIRNTVSGAVTVAVFGTGSEFLSQLDYTGDGRADIAASANGVANLLWYVRNSATGAVFPYGLPWGPTTNRVRVPADYDGDGTADVAVFLNTSGQWWMRRSTAGLGIVTWGSGTDIPVNGFPVQ